MNCFFKIDPIDIQLCKESLISIIINYVSLHHLIIKIKHQHGYIVYDSSTLATWWHLAKPVTSHTLCLANIVESGFK